jgi:hypothetical protein
LQEDIPYLFLKHDPDDNKDSIRYNYFQMNIYKNKFASRLGLMHMIATNLCVWINVLIMETKHEVLHYKYHGLATAVHYDDVDINNGTDQLLPQPESLVSHVLSACSDRNTVMGKLMSTSAPFLFPCTIEYSLICAAILYTMWKNIGPEHSHYTKTLARIGRKESTINFNPSDQRYIWTLSFFKKIGKFLNFFEFFEFLNFFEFF